MYPSNYRRISPSPTNLERQHAFAMAFAAVEQWRRFSSADFPQTFVDGMRRAYGVVVSVTDR